MLARPVPQTRISAVHQWGRCIATMRGDTQKRAEPRSDSIRTELALAGIVRGRGPPPDDLLGELDQHPPGIVVLQLAKYPQQPQFEQNLHRLGIGAAGFYLSGLGRRTAEQIVGDAERVGDL